VIEVNAAVDFDHRYSLAQRDVYFDVAFALDLLQLARTKDEVLARRARDTWRPTRVSAARPRRQGTR
jgi:hypothetical protein